MSKHDTDHGFNVDPTIFLKLLVCPQNGIGLSLQIGFSVVVFLLPKGCLSRGIILPRGTVTEAGDHCDKHSMWLRGRSGHAVKPSHLAELSAPEYTVPYESSRQAY